MKHKKLAGQAGFHITSYPADTGWVWCSDGYPIDEELERFAELVRADEREACAKYFDLNDTSLFWGSKVATAIRARGNYEDAPLP
jgi:hypothetical protein